MQTSGNLTPTQRLEICQACPLYKEDPVRGHICDPDKWISPETGKASSFPRKGYVQGCACSLAKKTKQPNAQCVAGKW